MYFSPRFLFWILLGISNVLSLPNDIKNVQNGHKNVMVPIRKSLPSSEPTNDKKVHKREEYGYSTSIIHMSPDGTKHAQSEVNVKLGSSNTDSIAQPSRPVPQKIIAPKLNSIVGTKFGTIANTPNNNAQFQSTANSNNFLTISSPNTHLHSNHKYPHQMNTNSANHQNQVFNVGYSIGFAADSKQPKNVQPPTTQFQQIIPREQHYHLSDIVTGIPTAKVQRPIEPVQSNTITTSVLSPSNGQDSKSYVLSALQNIQQQNVQVPAVQSYKNVDQGFPEHRENSQLELNTFQQQIQGHVQDQKNIVAAQQIPPHSYNQVQQLTIQPISHANNFGTHNSITSTPIKTVTSTTSYGWKNLSPGVEISTGSLEKHQQPFNQKVKVVPAQTVQTPTLVAAATINQNNFDHQGALGHSIGFDYSNAVNFEKNLIPSGRLINQDLPSKFEPSINSPVHVDKSFLDIFYKNYQPVNLNLEKGQVVKLPNSFENYEKNLGSNFNEQYGVQADDLTHPAPSTINTQESYPSQIQLNHNSLQVDSGLLKNSVIAPMQAFKHNFPIKVDTSLLEKALANINNAHYNVDLNNNQAKFVQQPIVSQQNIIQADTQSHNNQEQIVINYQEPKNHNIYLPQPIPQQQQPQQLYSKNHALQVAAQQNYGQNNIYNQNVYENTVNHQQQQQQQHFPNQHLSTSQSQQITATSDQYGNNFQTNQPVIHEEVITGKPKNIINIRPINAVNRNPRLVKNGGDYSIAIVKTQSGPNNQYYALNTELVPPPYELVKKYNL